MFKQVATATFVAALSLPAFATEGEARLDANDDGLVTMEEFNAVYPDAGTDVFTSVDTNGDGALSEAEVAAGQEAGVLMGVPSSDG